MTYIQRDGKIYEQIISEREVNLEEEQYKLDAWKAALENDAREFQEYQAKLAEIEVSNLNTELKEKLRNAITVSSPSGIKQEMVDEQESKLSSIVSIIDVKDIKK